MTDSDLATWAWVGHYMWVPMMAVFGWVAMTLWNTVNKRIDDKADALLTKERLDRIEETAELALERRIFEEYTARLAEQRKEDRALTDQQFARIEGGQIAISDKVDHLTALVLNLGGRRKGEGT